MDINVKFVYTKQYDEVTAVFINEYSHFLDCYAHIGQHSLCCIEWVNEQRKATKKQYKDLLNELTNIGYNVTVKN